MSDETDGKHSYEVGLSKIHFVSWIAISTLLILGPCLVNRRLRRLYWRRLCLFQWNVPTDDINAASHEIFRRGFTPRYSPGDPRYNITKEQAEQMKKDYINKSLEGFTKIINQSDFTFTYDADIGVTKVSKEEKDNGTGRIEGDNKPDSILDIIKKKVALNKGGDHEDLERQAATPIPNAMALKCPSAGISDSEAPLAMSDTDSATSLEGSIVKDNPQDENSRHIHPECSICLAEYKIGDEICWSPNKNCPHAFHVSCITEWLLTLGRGQSVKFRRDLSIHCDFKMQCPVCRGDFICTSASSSSTDPTDEETGNAED